MRKAFALSLTVLTAVTLASARPAVADTEITTCGQEIERGAAYLSGDLDCTGTGAYYGVRFSGRGIVDLRGFTIRNANVAISCEGNCNVRNGSLIDNLTNVAGFRVNLTDVTIGRDQRGTNYGAVTEHGANLKNVTIDGALDAVVGIRGTIKLDTVTITSAQNAVLTEGTIIARNTTVTSVSRAGFTGTRVKLIDSSVTGSGTDPDCNTLITLDPFARAFSFFLCGDVLAAKKPSLRSSTCDTSLVLSSLIDLTNPADWNVCTLD